MLFYFLLGVFLIILVAVLYSAFSGKGDTTLIVGLVGFEGLIAWAIRRVTMSLFPNPSGTERVITHDSN